MQAEKRYKQQDSYNCGVLVAVNMMMRMSLVSQPHMEEIFDCGVLHHVCLISCYILLKLYEKYEKYPSKIPFPPPAPPPPPCPRLKGRVGGVGGVGVGSGGVGGNGGTRLSGP